MIRAHQESGAEWLHDAWSKDQAGRVLAYEQGLGKTLTVLRFLERAELSRALVLCPAIARREWLRQINLFYPGWSKHIKLSSESKEVAQWDPAAPGLYITGYNPKLTAQIRGEWQSVIADEVQEISNPDVMTSALVRGIIESSPDCFFVGMSGTPAMDNPSQVWHIASLCQPGAWGQNIGYFKVRYLQKQENEHAPRGYIYKGLREDRRAELERRLGGFMHRIRKEDVMADLPKLTISLRYVKPKRAKALDWDSEVDFSSLMGLNSSAKIDATAELIHAAKADGQSRFVVFTFLKATAAEIGERLGAAGYNVRVVTGDTAPDRRHIPIGEIAAQGGVLVCTIDSVGVALDFTFAETAIFAEQHWQPGATSQALGRLHRLSSTHPVSCYFVVVEGSPEERKAAAFVRKLDQLEAVVSRGSGEAGAAAVLTPPPESDTSILSELLS